MLMRVIAIYLGWGLKEGLGWGEGGVVEGWSLCKCRLQGVWKASDGEMDWEYSVSQWRGKTATTPLGYSGVLSLALKPG